MLADNQEAARPREGEPGTPGALPDSRERRILLVEDEPLWRSVLQRRLTMAGYEVWSATNGQIALDLLVTAGALPDLILTDLLMPGGTGYDLCANVRSNPRLAHLPIIVMSSLDNAESRASAHRFGVYRYLLKPVPAAELQATVVAALALYRPRRSTTPLPSP